MKLKIRFGLIKKRKTFQLRARFQHFNILALILCSLLETVSYAAPCCARNSAIPALIIGDDQAQVNIGYTHATVVAEANEEGILEFGSPNSSDVSQMQRLDFSYMVSDRFQLGTSFSLVRHSVSEPGQFDSTLALGDYRINAGYEILPVWNYSKWKPQIFIFTSFTIPTGRSKYEYQNSLLSDVTGNGFYSVSIGSITLKRWGNWDAFLIPEIHYAFPRTFDNHLGNVQVYPQYGGSMALGGGWSPGGGAFRFGLRIQPRLDQSTITVLSDKISQTEGFLSVCDTGFDAAFLLGSTDSLMMSFTDQTLLGVATNLNVNRTFALNYQHRWER